MKNLSQSLLSVAVVAAAVSGFAEQAAANVYGGAGNNIDDLSIQILNGNGSLANITSFDFRTQTTADLNTVPAATSIKTCFGVPTLNTCNAAGTASAAYAPIPLNSDPASIGIARVDNAFTFLGPNGGDYGSSDNVIWDAAVANPPSAGCIPGTSCDLTTHVQSIAEAELGASGSAGAGSQIRSTTQFSLNFELTTDNGSFSLGFLADPDLYAELTGADLLLGTASATIFTEFKLTGGNGDELFTWNPDGDIEASDCVNDGAGSAMCTENADTQKLNETATAPFQDSDDYSWDPIANPLDLTAFGIDITGLSAGSYAFTLTSDISTNVTRLNQVPEPATLGLLGLGLAGLGLGARRRRKA